MKSKRIKLRYSATEIARELGEKPQTIYYWRDTYQLKLPTTKEGTVRFSSENYETLKMIHFLLREKKLTEEGVKSVLNNKSLHRIDEKADVLLLLQKIDAELSSIIATMDKFSMAIARRSLDNEK